MHANSSAEPFVLRHEIFILDANLQAPLPNEQREAIARPLTEDLLRTLGMFPLGPLSIFEATDQRAPGWSFIQPLTTSHLSGHYFEKPGDHPHIHMDVYSCDSVDWKKVIDCVDRHLHLGEWRGTFVCREMKEGAREVWDICGNFSRVTQTSFLAPHCPAFA